jgi:hypothetical protein
MQGFNAQCGETPIIYGRQMQPLGNRVMTLASERGS